MQNLVDEEAGIRDSFHFLSQYAEMQMEFLKLLEGFGAFWSSNITNCGILLEYINSYWENY